MAKPKASSESLYNRIRLSRAIEDAIDAVAKRRSEVSKEELRVLIRRLAYRRKYDGEFLTRRRPSRNRRTPE